MLSIYATEGAVAPVQGTVFALVEFLPRTCITSNASVLMN